MKCPECNDNWFDSDVFCYRCGYVEKEKADAEEQTTTVFNAIAKIYNKNKKRIKAILKII